MDRRALAIAEFNRARAAASGGRWDEARLAYRRCINLQPQNADAWLELGCAELLSTGHIQSVLAAHRQAAALRHPDGWHRFLSALNYADLSPGDLRREYDTWDRLVSRREEVTH